MEKMMIPIDIPLAVSTESEVMIALDDVQAKSIVDYAAHWMKDLKFTPVSQIVTRRLDGSLILRSEFIYNGSKGVFSCLQRTNGRFIQKIHMGD